MSGNLTVMNRPGSSPVVAVLLAAGAGQRFAPENADAHKLLAELEGRPLLEISLSHALLSGLPVVVVTGADPRVEAVARELAGTRPGVVVVHNPAWADGQATSVQSGIGVARAMGASVVVVGLADQPGVLSDAWRTVASCERPVAVATYAGVRGHPVRLAAEVWPLLPTQGEIVARDLMRLRPELVEEVPCQGSADDVDTLEDLQRWN